MTIQYLFYILFGYLSGSVLYGYLLSKYIKKIDVTKESSDRIREWQMHFSALEHR